MDNVRAFEDEADFGAPRDEEAVIEAPPEIGIDERRMHVRAYNYWVSLLEGRPYPLIVDLEPHNIDDFGPNSVLLDFSTDSDDPTVAFIGRALREECGLAGNIIRISQVPSRSLLSRLTDHYLQIIANRAPIGFEAEFVGQRGANTMYRGILMPFSSTGETIDFIYGVINWKELVDTDTASEIGRQVDRALAATPAPGAGLVWADGPNAETLPVPEDNQDEPELDLADYILDADAGLADRLVAARDGAEAAKGVELRSRAALYRALGLAYDFALAAEAEAEDYAELLEDAGLKPQARAPMTPIVKLVFGADYDKTRLTEYAAALSWANRQALPMGSLRACLESFEGGLKGMVAAERRARRPEQAPDKAEAARSRLRNADTLARLDIGVDAGEGEFVLLIARNEGAAGLAVVAPVADRALVERAIRQAGR
ncbi:PAS domain-containing protein [Sphingosinicella rhizophila]|uniref:Uncharacterized protein n=1 Tax=Sphingosinicella rhizophila TaxID=3050082 RepID=A0ABU3Q7A9_9SPHN|nr:hypothetical protein [Sphingosinicella sp. GR2756]MDT9599289.1 hypothetical protein [Sphingosinicella sp. GR2756]